MTFLWNCLMCPKSSFDNSQTLRAWQAKLAARVCVEHSNRTSSQLVLFHAEQIQSWWNLVSTKPLQKHLPHLQGQIKPPAARFISITQTFSRLLALYSESLSRTYRVATGDSLHLVLRTLFSRWRTGPRCSIFLWARVLFLPVFFNQLSSLPAFSVMFAVQVGADCIWFAVLPWGAYSLDSLPVTLTFSLVCIPPSVPACWRTTYCPSDACTFDAFPFPSRRNAGSRTLLTNASTMRELPLDLRSGCSSAECATCHYTQTWSNIQYRAPLQYYYYSVCLSQPNTE